MNKERIFHFEGNEYHLIKSEIHTPLGYTSDFHKCQLGCGEMISGSQDDSHVIEKHTMKEFLDLKYK